MMTILLQIDVITPELLRKRHAPWPRTHSTSGFSSQLDGEGEMKHAYKPVYVPSEEAINTTVNHDLTLVAFDE